jgi:hypothetical protein
MEEENDANIIDANEESKTTAVEMYQEDSPEERKKNSDYLADAFLFMKNLVSTIEAEIESIKNKKAKGATFKKYKER